jgi:DnaA-homolog protein
MKQMALDIALTPAPALANFLAGSNGEALEHLKLWVGEGRSTSQAAAWRSPVPCYLWGESASGKSYLLRAVREALRGQGGEVGWLDPSMHEPEPFNPAWVAVMLDDVQAYSPVQQHAAFNYFVNAQIEQRWILAAGHAPPADLPLRDDLRSRLGWGHVFALRVLTEGERRSVLRREADARGIFLSDEVMDFILQRFARDLNSLMQFLQQLDGYCLVAKRAVTVPLIKSMLESL